MGPYLPNPVTTKAPYMESNTELTFVVSDMQGWRKTMEDAHFGDLKLPGGNSCFGVFDGHGGPEVSKFAARYFVKELVKNPNYQSKDYKIALIETFKKIDQLLESPAGQAELRAIRKEINSNGPTTSEDDAISQSTGCTANVLLVTPTHFYCASAGDSRAVLCRAGNAIALSEDHKPENETEIRRIEKAGGAIVGGRVNGGLNLTRALGDFFYKREKNLAYDEQLIICKPDVKELERSKTDDEFVVMGCDGIWQKYVTNNQGMVEKVTKQKASSSSLETLANDLLDSFLAKETSEEVGCDNMTIILIFFKKGS